MFISNLGTKPQHRIANPANITKLSYNLAQPLKFSMPEHLSFVCNHKIQDKREKKKSIYHSLACRFHTPSKSLPLAQLAAPAKLDFSNANARGID